MVDRWRWMCFNSGHGQPESPARDPEDRIADARSNEDKMSYTVKELFLTLQGEGAQAGRTAVFCRFAGC